MYKCISKNSNLIVLTVICTLRNKFIYITSLGHEAIHSALQRSKGKYIKTLRKALGRFNISYSAIYGLQSKSDRMKDSTILKFCLLHCFTYTSKL